MTQIKLEPAFPTHPGLIIKDELEYRGISQRVLAREMGIAYSMLNEMLNGNRPITEKTAMLFEAVLGLDAEPILRLQLKYNLRSARNDRSFMKRIESLRRLTAAL